MCDSGQITEIQPTTIKCSDPEKVASDLGNVLATPELKRLTQRIEGSRLTCAKQRECILVIDRSGSLSDAFYQPAVSSSISLLFLPLCLGTPDSQFLTH